jgi:hypothetical protein
MRSELYWRSVPFVLAGSLAACPSANSGPTTPASTSASDVAVGGAAGAAPVPLVAPDTTNPSGAFSCAGLEQSGVAGSPGLPLCKPPASPPTPVECKSNGFHFHVDRQLCVDECLPPETEKPDGTCCVTGAQGQCCGSASPDAPSALRAGQDCDDGANSTGGGRSDPNPCPSNRPFYKCNGIGSCRCSKNP